MCLANGASEAVNLCRRYVEKSAKCSEQKCASYYILTQVRAGRVDPGPWHRLSGQPSTSLQIHLEQPRVHLLINSSVGTRWNICVWKYQRGKYFRCPGSTRVAEKKIIFIIRRSKHETATTSSWSSCSASTVLKCHICLFSTSVRFFMRWIFSIEGHPNPVLVRKSKIC